MVLMYSAPTKSFSNPGRFSKASLGSVQNCLKYTCIVKSWKRWNWRWFFCFIAPVFVIFSKTQSTLEKQYDKGENYKTNNSKTVKGVCCLNTKNFLLFLYRFTTSQIIVSIFLLSQRDFLLLIQSTKKKMVAN